MAPIKMVGIIGAGVSGVAAAVHLKAAGLHVTVFERTAVSGGVWVFDERKPPEPPYPSLTPSTADFTAAEQPLDNDESSPRISPEVWHAPPGPCYEGLRNNVPTPLLEMTINSWQPGTEDIVTHHVLKDYIQDTAAKYDVDSSTWYNTRVEKVVKEGGKWHVQTSTLSTNPSAKLKKVTRHWAFDYLVVATGHYHAERIPNTPGLKEWKEAWPARVQHSKSYRRAKDFKGQTVLIVGGGTSAVDIAKEIGPSAEKIYQSTRGGLFDLPIEMLPPNAENIGEIASYHHNDSQSRTSHTEPVYNSITLTNGSVLYNIDRIILATGYHCSFPFLPDLHRDDLRPQEADKTCLVTDGTQMHNLHVDIFYIPDPSLAFIGVPFFSATFSLFEFQAIAVARIFSQKTDLPAREQMEKEYEEKIAAKGVGKPFHSVRGKGNEVGYVNSLVDLVNSGIGGRGVSEQEKMKGHSAKWLAARVEFERKIEGRWKELKMAEKDSEKVILPDTPPLSPLAGQ